MKKNNSTKGADFFLQQKYPVKLLTLNIWGGHLRQPLMEFIKSYQEIDIFCLQEVYNSAQYKISYCEKKFSLNIFSELKELLPKHTAFFTPVVGKEYGIGVFIKQGIKILEKGAINIYDNPNYPGYGPTHSRNLQWVKCVSDAHIFFILNVHGLWSNMGKTDTPDRLVQSQKIKNFMDSLKAPKILCGDFNLRPDTRSIKIIEKKMNNLIRKYDIKSTRTSLYKKEEKFADYIFTSPDVSVNTFEVLKNEISDHSPLFLSFQL